MPKQPQWQLHVPPQLPLLRRLEREDRTPAPSAPRGHPAAHTRPRRNPSAVLPSWGCAQQWSPAQLPDGVEIVVVMSLTEAAVALIVGLAIASLQAVQSQAEPKIIIFQPGACRNPLVNLSELSPSPSLMSVAQRCSTDVERCRFRPGFICTREGYRMRVGCLSVRCGCSVLTATLTDDDPF
eukprot:1532294-Rhodomonas_salina.1